MKKKSKKTFYVQLWDSLHAPGYILGVEMKTPEDAAIQFVRQNPHHAPTVLHGSTYFRVQEEGSPKYVQVQVALGKDQYVARVEKEYDTRETSRVFFRDDYGRDIPVPTISPPHLWTVFRVFYGNEEDPILVIDVSFEAALKKAENAGLEVQAISRVDFVEGVERMDVI